MKLTSHTVRAITPVPPKTEIIVFDDDGPGFGVRARLNGWKAFIVQYSIGNRQRRLSLGKVDELDVDEARQMAKEILIAVRMGPDSTGEQFKPSAVGTPTLPAGCALYSASRVHGRHGLVAGAKRS